MEEEIRLCEVCQENALNKLQTRFCSKACRTKFCTAQQIIKRKQMTKEKREKPTFPVWTCDNGHRNQLDFCPIKNKKRFDEFNCTICQREYTKEPGK